MTSENHPDGAGQTATACNTRYVVVVPVKNGGDRWREAAESLRNAVLEPRQVLVVDSGSRDGSDELAVECGFRLHRIPPESFNHGATRQLAVDLYCNDADIAVFLTQDAVPTGPRTFKDLLGSFDDPEVGCAYGRQLPQADADPYAAHAVLFNYPEQSRTQTWSDRARMGIKAAFISNSFAAYRISDLKACGGFPSHLIAGEDVVVGLRMLQIGRSIRYCATATVRHSHNTSLWQEMERNFDWGVMHAQFPTLVKELGEPIGEGLRFIRSEVGHLAHDDPGQLLPWLIRTPGKFLAYQLGRRYRVIPNGLRRKLSMTKGFWTTAARPAGTN